MKKNPEVVLENWADDVSAVKVPPAANTSGDERERLFEDLGEIQKTGEEKMAALKPELDLAISRHEEILEIARRREKLANEFVEVRNFYSMQAADIRRKIEAATPPVLKNARSLIERQLTIRQGAERGPAEKAKARLDRLLHVSGRVDDLVQEIMSDLASDDCKIRS